MLAQFFNPKMKHFPKGIITAIHFFQKFIHSFNMHLLVVHHALGCSYWLSRSPRRHTEDLGEETTLLWAFEGTEEDSQRRGMGTEASHDGLISFTEQRADLDFQKEMDEEGRSNPAWERTQR